MRDSPATTRDDDNPVVIMRCYRRTNKVATTKLVWGCGSWSRPVTPIPSSYNPTPSSCPSSSSSSSSSESYPPPSEMSLSPVAFKSSSIPAVSTSSCRPKLSSWKMECKEISKFTLENGMKIKILPRLFESKSMDQQKMGPCVSLSLLGGY
jgi:hypothetical protein